MEERIRQRYHLGILDELRLRYRLEADQIKALDGFESFIFEVRGKERPYILRMSHSLRRSETLLYGEIDWINYLADRGVGVARALASPQGNLIEFIPDGQDGHFLIVAFTQAAGEPSWVSSFWGDDLFAAYGRQIGRMHALTKSYVPGDPSWKRPEWDDKLNLEVADWVPQKDSLIRQRYQVVLDHLRTLPRTPDSYGLIHQDAHMGNFYVDNNLRLTMFDFDDCVYGWFVYDIAMVLFYAAANRQDPVSFGRDFWRAFWPGYREENTLDPAWLVEIPWFLKLREIELYGVIHRSLDVDNLQDPWIRGFMNGRKELLEANEPFIDLDFARFAEDLDTGHLPGALE